MHILGAFNAACMAITKRPTLFAPAPRRPRLKSVLDFAAPRVVAAGLECYQKEGAFPALIRQNLAWVKVKDGKSTHQVLVPLEYFAPYCPCAKGSRVKLCLHGVAALLHVIDEFDDLISDNPWRHVRTAVASVSGQIIREFLIDALDAIEQDEPEQYARIKSKREWFEQAMLDGAAQTITDGEVRRFAADMLRNSGKSRELFIIRFGEPDLPNHLECRAEMAYMFGEATRMAANAPRVGLADFFKAAKARESRGDIDEAILTYREISEAVLFGASELEDVKEYYLSSLAKALKQMASCIRRHCDAEQRRHHIEYLHGRLANDSYYWFDEKYRAALFHVCASRGDLEHLGELHSLHLAGARPNSDERHSDMMQSMQKEISSRLAGG